MVVPKCRSGTPVSNALKLSPEAKANPVDRLAPARPCQARSEINVFFLRSVCQWTLARRLGPDTHRDSHLHSFPPELRRWFRIFRLHRPVLQQERELLSVQRLRRVFLWPSVDA